MSEKNLFQFLANAYLSRKKLRADLFTHLWQRNIISIDFEIFVLFFANCISLSVGYSLYPIKICGHWPTSPVPKSGTGL